MPQGSRVIPPAVAIVGRPNVGKSSLFNYLVGSRKSVVKNQPGVTRDILEETVEVWGKTFRLYDTGGLTEASDEISELIRNQVTEFLKTVDVIIFMLDGKAGIVPEDKELFRTLKSLDKPFITIVNKIDRIHDFDLAQAEFYDLGVDILSVSVEHRHGMAELLEWLSSHLPECASQELDSGRFKLGILGKPNAGKSSLTNKILGRAQVLVSDKAGTTIDSNSFDFEWNGIDYTLVDTAGLRKAAKRKEGLEKISSFKTRDALLDSDLILLVVDVLEGVGEQEAKIVEMALDSHKPVILVANKMDEGEKKIPECRLQFKNKVQEVFHFYDDIPLVFISALTGKGFKDLFKVIEDIRSKLDIRISTSALNDFFFRVIRQAPSPVSGTKTVKFFYLTQTQQSPPSFIAFANYPEAVHNAYRRFLMKRIKDQWQLSGIPVRIFVMKNK